MIQDSDEEHRNRKPTQQIDVKSLRNKKLWIKHTLCTRNADKSTYVSKSLGLKILGLTDVKIT